MGFSPTSKEIHRCNNFLLLLAERLFLPHRTKTCCMLSNDGCIISRSDKPKSRAFQWGSYFRKNPDTKTSTATFSSNYPQPMATSAGGVMETLPHHTGRKVEVYLKWMNVSSIFRIWGRISTQAGIEIRETVELDRYQSVRGHCLHKVLCKVANHLAKKKQRGNRCVVVLNNEAGNRHGSKTPVGDIWGVGRQYAKNCGRHGAYMMAISRSR